MSAEGKKKRGISGQANAKNIAFRYGGRPANYSVTLGNPTSKHGAGSLLVRAMALGDLLTRMGHPSGPISGPMVTRVEAAMDRCTHKDLR